jgi:hypothetical protein
MCVVLILESMMNRYQSIQASFPMSKCILCVEPQSVVQCEELTLVFIASRLLIVCAELMVSALTLTDARHLCRCFSCRPMWRRRLRLLHSSSKCSNRCACGVRRTLLLTCTVATPLNSNNSSSSSSMCQRRCCCDSSRQVYCFHLSVLGISAAFCRDGVIR